MDAASRARCEAHIGRTRRVADAMAPAPARRLQALLDATPSLAAGETLPPTWHWAYLADEVAQSDIGPDGHERLGRFLPPAPFHRRMWAAGDIVVHRPLRLGLPAERVATITSVTFKTGRSGEMCFVTVQHEIAQEGAACVSEEQTVVYRDRGPPTQALRRHGDPLPEGYMVHDDAQLFRYSAVTHNAHRIHWDRAFCREVEGYPDLVVHGPLLATRLCDAMRGGETTVRFTFRALAPVFVTSPVRLETGEPGGPREGRIERSDGEVAMTGRLMRG